MKVSDPIGVYNTPYFQGLKNRLISSIDSATDEEKSGVRNLNCVS